MPLASAPTSEAESVILEESALPLTVREVGTFASSAFSNLPSAALTVSVAAIALALEGLL